MHGGPVIRVREQGSYVIEGDDVTVVDWNGNPYPTDRRPIAAVSPAPVEHP